MTDTSVGIARSSLLPVRPRVSTFVTPRSRPPPHEPTRLVVLGRHGSGKSVQCAKLTRRLRVPYLSVTEEFRRAIRDQTVLGIAVKGFLTHGIPVPDELALQSISTELGFSRDYGYVIDGFPTTVPQARALLDFLSPAAPDAVICIDMSNSAASNRVRDRRVCVACGSPLPPIRADVTCARCGTVQAYRPVAVPDSMRRASTVNDSHGSQLLDFLSPQTLVVHVRGTGDPDAVAARIWDALHRPPAGVAACKRPAA